MNVFGAEVNQEQLLL